MNKAFVFVVCGSREHINELHFSLKALKKYTNHKIYVVTDIKRNEIPIYHDLIIDVETPSHLSNHQASIYLKTSLHRLLPPENLYCYLDSDVIALNIQCNNVFDYYVPPVTFAYDHTTLSYFSPYALNCNCLNRFYEEQDEFQKAISNVVQHPNFPPDYNNIAVRKLFAYQKSLLYSRKNLFSFLIKIFFAFIRGKVKLSKNIAIDLRSKKWVVESTFEYPVLLLHYTDIKKKTDYRFDLLKKRWKKKDGKYLAQNRCNHLQEAFKNIFNIDVDPDFHHWNGGVFLFDEQSSAFMDKWHKMTLQIFDDPFWKVRDQATLIATVHLFKLENHKLLPEKFNFIADFYKPEITTTGEVGVFYKGKSKIKPSFIHIYHQWGNSNWEIWNEVKRIVES